MYVYITVIVLCINLYPTKAIRTSETLIQKLCARCNYCTVSGT